MASSDDPVLRWIRDLITQRNMNTAELAAKSGLERGRLRRLLGGTQPMLVDELMKISSALELSAKDMGLPGLEADADLPLPPPPPPPDPAIADPYGNHARQLFEVGFALGCSFYFAADVAQLEDSGVPEAVLKQHAQRGEVVLSLDAAHHRDNDPRIDDQGITLTLSFDDLYDCTFPWSAIRRVIFTVDESGDDTHDQPPPHKGPHLRLVT